MTGTRPVRPRDFGPLRIRGLRALAAALLGLFGLPGLLGLLAVDPALAEPGESSHRQWSVVDREATLLAILTHKAGMAKGLAHDHLIVAGDWTGEIRLDLQNPERSSGRIVVPVAGLRADDPDDRRLWEEAILAAGVREEPLGELGDSDRRKVEAAMRSKEQLDAAHHPEIEAELLGLERTPTEWKGAAWPWTARLELRIRGQSATVVLAARIDEPPEDSGGPLQVEAGGTSAFTAFGIEPYSALFGAVRNRDDFDVYVRARLLRPSTGSAH